MNEEHYQQVIDYSNAMQEWGLSININKTTRPYLEIYAADLQNSILRSMVLAKSSLMSSNLRSAYLHGANLCGTNLQHSLLDGADLSSVYASGVDLSHALMDDSDLREAYLGGANLNQASLVGADLRNAIFMTANLNDVDFQDATMNWNSHELIGERLRQAAGDNYQRMALAGAIAMNPNHCWDYWLNETPKRLREWALRTMATWVKEGDDAPQVVLDYVGK